MQCHDLVLNITSMAVFLFHLISTLSKITLTLYSLLTLKSVVIPILSWILPGDCSQLQGQHLCDHTVAVATYSFLRSVLIQIFYVSSSLYALKYIKDTDCVAFFQINV